MLRKTPLRRTGKLKPVNRKRKAQELRRAFGTEARREWISRLPCWACGYAGPSPRDNAHSVSGGKGRRADAEAILALCRPCHMRQHAEGWGGIGLTPEQAKAAAAFTASAWRRVAEADEG